jgi:hypothetical protein
MVAAQWTDIVSALGAVITPLLVLVIGIFINGNVRRLEQQEWRNQELIEARLERYDGVATPLNQILCYFTYIGTWKDFTPPEIVQLKRDLDMKFFIAAPLFSPQVKKRYERFMKLCFKPFGPWGRDAKLRTKVPNRRKPFGNKWQPGWDDMFEVRDDVFLSGKQLEEIRDAYNDLIVLFMADVGLAGSAISVVTADVSANAH